MFCCCAAYAGATGSGTDWHSTRELNQDLCSCDESFAFARDRCATNRTSSGAGSATLSYLAPDSIQSFHLLTEPPGRGTSCLSSQCHAKDFRGGLAAERPSSSKPFRCIQCGATYAYQYSLSRHHYKCEGTMVLTCSFCERTFHRKDRLREHLLNKHSNEELGPPGYTLIESVCSELADDSHAWLWQIGNRGWSYLCHRERGRGGGGEKEIITSHDFPSCSPGFDYRCERPVLGPEPKFRQGSKLNSEWRLRLHIGILFVIFSLSTPYLFCLMWFFLPIDKCFTYNKRGNKITNIWTRFLSSPNLKICDFVSFSPNSCVLPHPPTPSPPLYLLNMILIESFWCGLKFPRKHRTVILFGGTFVLMIEPSS